MSDLGTMRARIADELLDQGELTSAQIDRSILSAIKHYEREGFWFNSKVATFATVAAQELYTSADLADIPNIVTIDSMQSQSGSGSKTRVRGVENNMIEDVQDGTVTGEPELFSRYADKIRLYPIPSSVYTMTMSYIYKLDTLAVDADTNAWMTECEELIRQSAKRLIAQDILYSPEIVSVAAQAESVAYSRLRKENRLRQPQKELRSGWPFNHVHFDALRG